MPREKLLTKQDVHKTVVSLVNDAIDSRLHGELHFSFRDGRLYMIRVDRKLIPEGIVDEAQKKASDGGEKRKPFEKSSIKEA